MFKRTSDGKMKMKAIPKGEMSRKKMMTPDALGYEVPKGMRVKPDDVKKNKYAMKSMKAIGKPIR